MTQQGGRRFLGALLACGVGVLITVSGLVLQQKQLMLALETRSMRPICDPSRNAVIDLCLPVFAALASVDFSFALFLPLILVNVLAWGAVFCIPSHALIKIVTRRGEPNESTA